MKREDKHCHHLCVNHGRTHQEEENLPLSILQYNVYHSLTFSILDQRLASEKLQA